MVKHHEVILSAPRDLAEGGAPAILQRSDDDFIEAVLAGLRDAGGRVGPARPSKLLNRATREIGRASCRERV